ncbi:MULTISPECIES: hypothetical protein [Streptomyces]|uniref:Uncharacterized protein n=1 Tax=Streptomyces tsukubensis (strain DSM 42081 / NBRC 108919 / NRRL 18488 / 9993) TaxID=1114943 RepID=I2N7U8_STRT9|nr:MULTISPECIES: hypothetical protein [Streptomyces]AZK97065.1 hypothetical protein B7R87_26735 [Streptomyces tsukubensis]EIF93095.1 regulator [Streptomyces tsukubensis NRRL18488]MYS66492.1 hypothetical protein [Streptomyces sp. SID5473]QKM66964.1 hypothetical protein STSU_007045 [Streptomyces tsukubensis NRRL18488]TAI41559.1 hypothetical protein EWI31_27405 [Streptomyces tsukubensis]
MTTTSIPNYDRLARTVAVLSDPGLIRLITEIDDHGPVPRAGLARTFPDLPRHELLRARDTARDLGLISTGSGAGHGAYKLAGRGADLAELYDRAARWARARDLPARDSSFVTRVRTTLDHLTRPGHHNETAASGAGHLLDALLGWTAVTPGVAHRILPEAA